MRDAGLCLYSLSAEARASGDTEKALALLDSACRLDVLFHGENAPGMHGNYELREETPSAEEADGAVTLTLRVRMLADIGKMVPYEGEAMEPDSTIGADS